MTVKYVSLKTNIFESCKLEDNGTLTFSDGDYRQGGTILSGNFYMHKDNNYWVAVEKQLMIIFEHSPNYYLDICKMIQANKIDIAKNIWETKTKYEEYNKNWDYENIYNAQRDCIHLNFSFDTPQQWLECKANHERKLCVENKDCYFRQLMKLKATKEVKED